MAAVAPVSADSGAAIRQDRLAVACDLLRALGTPHRLAIVLELADGPRCVHELIEKFGISQSLTSQHLRVLRSTGLVVGVRRGKETAYSLADEHVAHIARDALAHGDEPSPRVSETPHHRGAPPMTATHTVHDGHRHAARADHWDEH